MPRARFGKLPEEKRAKILMAARQAFAASGYQGASYNQIIEKAGVSKGAMYYYFDDKMDLFTTVMLEGVGAIVAFWEDAFAEDLLADDFWTGFEVVVRRQAHFAFEHPELMALGKILLEMEPAVASAGALGELQKLSRTWIDLIVVEGQSSGQVRADMPRELLVALLQSLGETFDRYFAAHMREVAESGPDKLVSLTVDTFRRVAQPRLEE